MIIAVRVDTCDHPYPPNQCVIAMEMFQENLATPRPRFARRTNNLPTICLNELPFAAAKSGGFRIEPPDGLRFRIPT